ncbi:unnamed protein product [Didymodactylos carnosus]|nr:unnamed protein product [Didymodactylos carnosus]
MEAECRILPLRLHLKMKRLKKAASIRSKALFNPLRKIIVKSKSCPLTIMYNEIESSMIVDEKLKMCMNNLELIPRFQPSPPSIISEIKSDPCGASENERILIEQSESDDNHILNYSNGSKINDLSSTAFYIPN